jgi:nucleoid-associated protein YgaU
VYLPDRLYEVKEAARQRIAKVIEQLDEDLRQQVITAPKPLVYTVGTLDDGGTLWGIAHLFYGDGKKWQQIYGANRESIKNPNMINDGMQLTIPKLQ